MHFGEIQQLAEKFLYLANCNDNGKEFYNLRDAIVRLSVDEKNDEKNKKNPFLRGLISNWQKMIDRLQDYYFLKDYEEGNGNFHAGIFNALFVDKKRFSFDEIAIKFSIDVKTLYRYRTKIIYLSEAFKIGHFLPD